MKDQPVRLGKVIAIMVLSVLLALSTFFNIFFLTIFGIKDAESFKKALFSKELLDGLTEVTEELTDTDVDADTSDDTVEDVPQQSDSTSNTDDTLTEEEIVFTSNGVTVTYLKQETSIFGPAFKFRIENNSDDTISVSFTDVYVDGYLVDLTGGGVYDLAPNKKAFATLTVFETDYEEFTNAPSCIEYTIKIMNSDLTTIAESETKQLTIK